MLQKLLENPPQTLLIEGGQEAEEAAQAFAYALLKTQKKNPADLRHLYPEGKAHHHPMHAIKQLIEDAALPPYEAERKVFVIHEAERMLPSSSNALLKTLEEPLPFVILILITSHIEKLLPTIPSRCFLVSFKQTSETEKNLAEQMFHVGFRLLRGDLPTSKEMPENVDPEKALSYLFYVYRDLHLLRSGASPSLLFFKDKEEVLSRINTPLPPLEILEKRFEKALLATELHIPLAH
ncbi:MAG: hypothetical protein KDK64_08340, partial [Chlamydiia bacterium]|nr:hypothetical protein [Chlamydiia bacterium]